RNLGYKAIHPKEGKFDSQLHYNQEENKKEKKYPIHAESAYLTIEALMNVARPDSEIGWQVYSGKNIAWKTGTSHGFRDAWSVGMTPEYVVGVWVGNADGEGRPGIIGVKAAAPVMFDVFNRLKLGKTFQKPKDGWTEVKTCKESGYLVGENCPEFARTEIPASAVNAPACPYHQKIHLDKTGKFRVN